MMALKNPKHTSSGFTFVEIMIALVIMATTLSALFGLQSTIFSRLVQTYNRVNRIFIIKKNVMDRTMEIEESGEKGKEYIEDPSTTIEWSDKKIQPQGIYEGLEHLVITHVRGSWKTLAGERSDDMIGISFRPPEEKENKKESKEYEEEQ